MDDESDDGLPGRLLRIGTGLFLFSLFLRGYRSVLTWLVPGPRLPDTLKQMLGGFLVSSAGLLVGAVILFKRQGLDAGTILFKALQQPRWWRPWYPKRFRRRGDIWDRLPAPIRRFRIWWAAMVVYIFAVYLPLYFGLLFLGQRLSVLQAILQAGAFAFIVSMAVFRTRTVSRLAETLKTSKTEASKLIGTPAWRTATWQRTLLQEKAPIPKADTHADHRTKL
jgi:hypothetical protein